MAGRLLQAKRAMYSFVNLWEIAAWDRFELESVCRAQTQAVYLGENTGLCRILGRYKFYVDTRDRGFGSNVLLDGFWEMWLTQFMARYVKPGMVAVDVGANYGYYSVLLADLVGKNGHLYAVEPNPRAALWLRRSLSLNGFGHNATVCEAAAGADDSRTLRLLVPNDEPKNATIVPQGERFTARDACLHEVPCRSLDTLTRPHERIDFMKIDAEGAEEEIFRGMAGILERQKPAIVLEFNTDRYANPADFMALIQKHYPALQQVNYSGDAVPVDAATVLGERNGEDWLLFLPA